MKKILLLQIIFCAIFLQMDVKAETISKPYQIISQRGLSTLQPSKGTNNCYYDKNGNLAISLTKDNSMIFYIYDENNRLVEQKTYLYYASQSKYVFSNLKLNSYKDGRLVKDESYNTQKETPKLTDSTLYSYDNDGNLIEANKWVEGMWDNNAKWSSKITYSDFQYPNCPKTVENWNLKYGTTWKYITKKTTNTYDSQKRIVKKEEKQRSSSDTTQYPNSLYTDYFYNVDNTIEKTESFKYENDQTKPYEKLEYLYNDGVLEMTKKFLTQLIWPQGDGEPVEEILARDEETMYSNTIYSSDFAPQNFNAEFTGNGTIKLTWLAPINTTDFIGYKLMFQDKEVINLEPSVTEYIISDLTIATYYATIQSVYGETNANIAEAIGSNIADVKFIEVSDPKCAIPTGLQLDGDVVFNEEGMYNVIKLKWNVPETEYEVLRYGLYVNDGLITEACTENTYTYNTYTSNDFKFEVKAFYQQGISPKSEPFTVSVLQKHKVVINMNNQKAGSVEGAGILDDNSTVTIKATANEGFKFKEWQRYQGGGPSGSGYDVVSTDLTYSFTLKRDETFIALFDQIKYEITATAHENGKISPSGISKVVHGKDFTYTITPNEDYVVKKLLIDGEEIPNSTHLTSYTFENVIKDHSIEVSFGEGDGIDENNDGSTMVFAHGKSIFVKITDNVSHKVEIMDVSGKIIRSMPCDFSTSVEIENPGVYIVRIINDDNRITTKKVVVH